MNNTLKNKNLSVKNTQSLVLNEETGLEGKMEETEMKDLPEDHKPYTDKYFIRTKQILEAENLNPIVSVNVFARGSGRLAGIDDAIAIIEKYADLRKSGGELWVTRSDTYTNKQPLMIIKAPAQDIVELETIYLGVLSSAISRANGKQIPTAETITKKFRSLKEIYKGKSLMYFGARHYHWSLDEMIGKAALEGGADSTSTDIGSKSISHHGVGTMPHFLILCMAYKYGRDKGTLKAAEAFDKYIDPKITRVTLVDTFNKELTDSLMVAKYFGSRFNMQRIDTCGENIGEGGSLYDGQKMRDPSFEVGTGVTIELAKNLRMNLIQNGYGPYTDTVLSSSFGDEKKARAFMQADAEFKKTTGYDLFTRVGIGEVSEAIFCTGDIFEIDGKPFSKVGREITNVDYKKLERVI
ncbi:MAG: nicotinate phosphoribosyltransferase [Candidatus Woesearchaeota archaeon]